MSYKVALIPGDGIGPEVSLAARRCVDALGLDIIWEECPAGEETLKKQGSLLPDSTINSIKKNKIALKGPIVTPIGTGFRSVNVAIRQILDLYACVRPAKTYAGVKSNFSNIDLVIVRENTEDLYAGIEFDLNSKEVQELISLIEKLQTKKIRKDSAISIKPISYFASSRIIDFAFQYALKYNRKKVTVVHKANIMKFTDGLFLRVAKEVAKKYEGRVEFSDCIVDNMCMQLVTKPQNYDVLVLPNLYGDVVSDLCAGLIGGLGIAPGANIGDGIAVFEAVHGSAPKYKGQNKVNPTAMILSAVLMLRYLNEEEAANKLERATADIIKENKFVTYDLKENHKVNEAVGTQEMADAIIKKLK